MIWIKLPKLMMGERIKMVRNSSGPNLRGFTIYIGIPHAVIFVARFFLFY